LRAEKARVKFVGGDRVDSVAEGLEGGEGGKILRLRKRGSECHSGGSGGGVEKVAARDRSHGIRG
jgi:hypothetical protein